MANALAEQTKKRTETIRTLLNQQSGELAKALPKHLTPERMLRTSLTCILRNPDLLNCDPRSLVACVMVAAELGLELSGPLGQAYMVPRHNKNIGGKEATFQIGYRGLQALAFRSEKVAVFDAHVVHKNDYFDYEYGSNQYLSHKPVKEGDTGPVVAAWARLKFLEGHEDFEVMTIDQLDAHYKQYVPSTKVWNLANMDEWRKKTVIRRLAKRAPVSVELVHAAVLDEYGEAGADQQLTTSAKTAASTQARLEALKEQIGGAPEDYPGDPEPEAQAGREPGVEPEEEANG